MKPTRRSYLGLALIVAGAVLVPLAVLAVFLYAPREAVMGEVQRIFYFHVSSAWIGFFAFFVTFVAGIGYLATGNRRWDIVALSSVEVGLVFIGMAVVTGSLWARPVWGRYWVWEPRLTISAVQLLVYVAYLMLRASSESPGAGARFAAVYGIVAFVTVPLSWFAIRWWRTIHPEIVSGGGMALAPQMTQTLMFSLLTFTVLYAALLWQRITLERTTDAVEALRYAADAGRD